MAYLYPKHVLSHFVNKSILSNFLKTTFSSLENRNYKFFHTLQPTHLVGHPRKQAGANNRVVHRQKMTRWNRQPGSIYDYDPSDYETETETRTPYGAYINLFNLFS